MRGGGERAGWVDGARVVADETARWEGLSCEEGVLVESWVSGWGGYGLD